MAELIKKAYFKNAKGIEQSAKLYTTLDEVSGQGVAVKVWSENLIPVDRRNFSSWNTYLGSSATVTQGISMPEWNTNAATRIQMSGGTSLTKYYLGDIGFMPTKGTYGKIIVYIKNIGATNALFASNGLTPYCIPIAPNAVMHAELIGTYNGASSVQMLLGSMVASDSADVIVYQPEMYVMQDAYMKYGEVSEPMATSARLKRYENLIPPEQRKFEGAGWAKYQGATVTVTQSVSVLEWNTTEATRVQTTGGTSPTKLVLGFAAPTSQTECARRIKLKNIGNSIVLIRANAIGSTIQVNPGEIIDYYSSGFGTGVASLQINLGTLVDRVSDSLDFIVYKPELYYTADLDKTWAVLSQAQVPYG